MNTPIDAIIIVALCCYCLGAISALVIWAWTCHRPPRKLQIERPMPLQPRRVVRHWDIDGTPDR